MTDQTGPTSPTRPDSPRRNDYRQVSSHLKAAGKEVTQLLDLLTEGLALDAQAQRDVAHQGRTPDGPPKIASSGSGASHDPGAGEPRDNR